MNEHAGLPPQPTSSLKHFDVLVGDLGEGGGRGAGGGGKGARAGGRSDGQRFRGMAGGVSSFGGGAGVDRGHTAGGEYRAYVVYDSLDHPRRPVMRIAEPVHGGR